MQLSPCVFSQAIITLLSNNAAIHQVQNVHSFIFSTHNKGRTAIQQRYNLSACSSSGNKQSVVFHSGSLNVQFHWLRHTQTNPDLKHFTQTLTILGRLISTDSKPFIWAQFTSVTPEEEVPLNSACDKADNFASKLPKPLLYWFLGTVASNQLAGRRVLQQPDVKCLHTGTTCQVTGEGLQLVPPSLMCSKRNPMSTVHLSHEVSMNGAKQTHTTVAHNDSERRQPTTASETEAGLPDSWCKLTWFHDNRMMVEQTLPWMSDADWIWHFHVAVTGFIILCCCCCWFLGEGVKKDQTWWLYCQSGWINWPLCTTCRRTVYNA